MAGEPELDNIKEEIPTGLAAINLNGVGYMDDKFCAELAEILNTEDVPIEWNCDHAVFTDEDTRYFNRKAGEDDEEIEYGSVVSKMPHVVSFTIKHSRYGRYAYAGLTMDPNDEKELPHGFGVRMSPLGLSKADGGILEKNKYMPLEDEITISLRWGKVELFRNGKLVDVLGEVPDNCVSMHAKLFLREQDLHVYLLNTATCCKVGELDLARNTVGDPGAASIAEVIGKDTTLITKLDLSLNRIRDPGAVKLAEALGSGACRVTDLNLSHNTIGDPGAQALAAALAKDVCPVVRLDLTDNDIGDGGCIRLAEAFGEETCSVTHVKLALNRIESAGFVALAEALERSTCNVTDISLGQNRPEKSAKRRLALAFAK
eukprot:CAMPEP_0204562264 /NCGR_PEP_ID=MMETSP0661-20131031/33655_1 /ASSEMBLY_ACC=CAM_ASM_000606 /TAXON_ID=109239 /ORGANISM="Alexandrium margalefi, Strain AMGDE01CS-322" /LENGTH=373 /DNA_ID=CAMNT_0051569739 /DNA_START=62 /DNA_END=1180 /DNA_ORIENTATION=-